MIFPAPFQEFEDPNPTRMSYVLLVGLGVTFISIGIKCRKIEFSKHKFAAVALIILGVTEIAGVMIFYNETV